MTRDHLKEALRITMDQTGWNAAADLIVDMTAQRLAGTDATDDALEALRHRLWPIWRDFEAVDA